MLNPLEAMETNSCQANSSTTTTIRDKTVWVPACWTPFGGPHQHRATGMTSTLLSDAPLTRQRRAIRETFRQADRPLSPQEVLERARLRIQGLGVATVYRNIRGLVEERWLRTVELPGTPDRYEVAGKEHHHHFHCRGCDGVFEVENCPGRIDDISPEGFALEAHEIILYGLCEVCNRQLSEPGSHVGP